MTPDGPKPDSVRPDGARPDDARPDDARPDDARRLAGDHAGPAGRRPRAHPDVEALDAVAGGGGSRSTARHLAGCDECTEAVDALRRVRAQLAHLASVTMPDDVAARIGATLANARRPAADDLGARTGHLSDPADPVGVRATTSATANPATDPATGPDAAAPAPAAGAGASGAARRAATDRPAAEEPTDPDGAEGPAKGRVGLPTPAAGGVIPHPAHRANPANPANRAGAGGGLPGMRRVRRRTGRPPGGRLVAHSLHSGRPPGRPDTIRSSRAGGDRGRSGGSALGALAAVCLLAVFVVAAVAVAVHQSRSGSAGSAGSASSVAVASRAGPGAGSAERGPALAPSDPPAARAAGGSAADSALAAVATSGYGLTEANAGQHAQDLLAGRVRGTRHVTFASDGSVAAPPTTTNSGPVTSPTAHPTATDPAEAALLTPDLQGCYLGLITQFGGSVRGVDLVTYGGMQAVAVVLSVPGTPEALRTAVLDPQCGGSTFAASLRLQTLSSAR
jgi:hypothetical protein